MENPPRGTYELFGWVPQAEVGGWVGNRVWLVPDDETLDPWLLEDAESPGQPLGTDSLVLTGLDDYEGPPEGRRGRVRVHDGHRWLGSCREFTRVLPHKQSAPRLVLRGSTRGISYGRHWRLDADVESALVAAVRGRAPGQAVLHALREHMVDPRTAVRTDDPTFVLVESTPAFAGLRPADVVAPREGAGRRSRRCHRARSARPAVAGLARFTLEAPSIARASEDPSRTMRDLFALLEDGWAATPLARQEDCPGQDG